MEDDSKCIISLSLFKTFHHYLFFLYVLSSKRVLVSKCIISSSLFKTFLHYLFLFLLRSLLSSERILVSMRERLFVRSEYSYVKPNIEYSRANIARVRDKRVTNSKYFIIHEKQIDLERKRERKKKILEQQIRNANEKRTQTPWTLNRNHPSRRERAR